MPYFYGLPSFHVTSHSTSLAIHDVYTYIISVLLLPSLLSSSLYVYPITLLLPPPTPRFVLGALATAYLYVLLLLLLFFIIISIINVLHTQEEKLSVLHSIEYAHS